MLFFASDSLPSHRLQTGETPEDMASKKQHQDVVDLLVARAALEKPQANVSIATVPRVCSFVSLGCGTNART